MVAAQIVFSNNISADLKSFLDGKDYTQVFIIADENTVRHCLPLLKLPAEAFELIQINSGEENKNLHTCEQIWMRMTELQLDRHALVINLGGGVIGDMGGWCAATYKRGIDFIQIPTTLLSQVDASVGGKLGIDFHSFKNHIGVFKNPVSVLIDTGFLNTLAAEEVRSGYAEIIKHCLIADKTQWDIIKTNPVEKQDWELLVQHSIIIKSKITEEDPLEKGLRKILNFGHTVGHAIESYFLPIPNKKLLHGEAIAIGMICEAHISYQKKFISLVELKEITKYILSIFPKKEIFDFDLEKILPITLHDKKNNAKTIQCSLLQQIGQGNFNITITLKEIRESILFYNLQNADSENKNHFTEKKQQ